MTEIAFVSENLERRPTAALVPYARNARTHSAEQVSQIAASMREFGWTSPILIDEDDGIIAGHGRLLAAEKLKLPEVPVIVAKGWSEAQKRAYVLADNKLSLNADWDTALLKIELSDLQTGGFDLSLTGFDALEVSGLLSTRDGLIDPEATPEPPATPVTQLGDLWILGEHRLICGDATDKATVERVLAGHAPHLMVTDPPYGVNYDPSWRASASAKGRVANDHRADWREAWSLFPGEVAYVWHSDRFAHLVAESLVSTEFEIRAQIIWNKSSMVIGRGHYHFKHEPAWYCVRRGRNAHWSGDRKQGTVWDIDHKRSETGHGTQKPVEAMARPMRNNSAPGDRVYEPFSGSGTTIIAGQMNKRIVHAVELMPEYVDVAIQRFEAFTGIRAVLEETDETYEEVKARRSEVV